MSGEHVCDLGPGQIQEDMSIDDGQTVSQVGSAQIQPMPFQDAGHLSQSGVTNLL